MARLDSARDGTGRGDSGEANGAVSQPTSNSSYVNLTAASGGVLFCLSKHRATRRSLLRVS